MPSDHRSTCPWKGDAHYYDGGSMDDCPENATGGGPAPCDAAAEIEVHAAFCTSTGAVTSSERSLL